MKKDLYFALGRPFSPLYSLLMRLRETAYRRGIFATAKFPVPVISVGNLTLGGTGKTPVVQHLAAILRQEGFRPAVISRGYGGATRKPVNVVSDGTQVLLDAEEVGDEPRMLAENLRDIPVLTGVVRKLPARYAVDTMGADLLILDDGFQHLAVQRDLDLVLFSADSLAGNSRVFPGGDLREPVAALHRCHAFLLTGVDRENRERAQRFADLLQERFPGKPVFFTRYMVDTVVCRQEDGQIVPMEMAELAGTSCLAFCGIARPESFAATLDRLPVEVSAFLKFDDHHHYKNTEVNRLAVRGQELAVDYLLTTEKDLAKLSRYSLDIPVYALRMQVEFPPQLVSFVFSFLGKKSA